MLNTVEAKGDKTIQMRESNGNTPRSFLVIGGLPLNQHLVPEYEGLRQCLHLVTNLGYKKPEATPDDCGDNTRDLLNIQNY